MHHHQNVTFPYYMISQPLRVWNNIRLPVQDFPHHRPSHVNIVNFISSSSLHYFNGTVADIMQTMKSYYSSSVCTPQEFYVCRNFIFINVHFILLLISLLQFFLLQEISPIVLAPLSSFITLSHLLHYT